MSKVKNKIKEILSEKLNTKDKTLTPCCNQFLNPNPYKKAINYTKFLSCIILTSLTIHYYKNYQDYMQMNNYLIKQDIDQRSDEAIKIWSYNIKADYLSENDDSPKYYWDQRKDLIIQQLENANPDIISFQEITPNMFEYITQELNGMEGSLFKRHDNDYSFGQAIFYNQDRFDLLDSGKFYFSETPYKYSVGWEKDVRICAWVKLHDKKTNNDFYVYNAHFTTHNAYIQQQSSKLINEKTKDLDAPVILTGDYNCTSLSLAYKETDKQFEDASKIALDTIDYGPTFNKYGNPLTYPSPIDFIFTSETDGTPDFHVASYERHDEYTENYWIDYLFKDGKFAISDHYAISADFYFNNDNTNEK